MKLLHQAEDILVGQDYVVDPLYFYTQKYMLRDGIEGMYYTPLGYLNIGPLAISFNVIPVAISAVVL